MAVSGLTYSKLREIQKKEMESFELAKLDKDFYSQLRAFIEAKRISAIKNQSLEEMRELENIRKVCRSIIAKRKEKLLALSAISTEHLDGLSEEEQQFFLGVRRLAAELFGQLESLFEDQKEEQMPRTKVKIIKAIEAYKGFDNNIYGPFKEGEEIVLPAEEAEWLLKNKMAEHIY